MKRSNLFLTLAAILAMTIGFAGLAQAEVVFKAGHVLAPNHPYHVGLTKFAELVDQKTGGEVKIEVFHSAQLGNEREMIEALQMGTLDVTLISTAPLAGFTKSFMVYDLPFIFKSTEEADKVLDGPIGQASMKSLETVDIIGLAFMENGFRNITNSKLPIANPADLKGLKIRTMENKIHMATFSLLGADPTPIASGEVFTALQQKTVDGQENPLTGIFHSKLYEVQKYLSLTGHFYSPAPLLIGKTAWDRLTPELQAKVQEAANEARDFQRAENRKQIEEALVELKAKGMEVTDNIDKAVWKEALMPIYKDFEAEIGADTINAVLEATK